MWDICIVTSMSQSLVVYFCMTVQSINPRSRKLVVHLTTAQSALSPQYGINHQPLCSLNESSCRFLSTDACLDACLGRAGFLNLVVASDVPVTS